MSTRFLNSDNDLDFFFPCPCVYLPNLDACKDCVVKPWKFTVDRHIKIEMDRFMKEYPNTLLKYKKQIEKEIESDVNTTIWQRHREDKEQQESTGKFVQRMIIETANRIFERRHQLVGNYILPTVDLLISQHFKILVGKDPKYACYKCGGGFHKKYSEENKYLAYFPDEKYPSQKLRWWLVEQTLPLVDLGIDVDVHSTTAWKADMHKMIKVRALDKVSNLFHHWLYVLDEEDQVKVGLAYPKKVLRCEEVYKYAF